MFLLSLRMFFFAHRDVGFVNVKVVLLKVNLIYCVFIFHADLADLADFF